MTQAQNRNKGYLSFRLEDHQASMYFRLALESGEKHEELENLNSDQIIIEPIEKRPTSLDPKLKKVLPSQGPH